MPPLGVLPITNAGLRELKAFDTAPRCDDRREFLGVAVAGHGSPLAKQGPNTSNTFSVTTESCHGTMTFIDTALTIVWIKNRLSNAHPRHRSIQASPCSSLQEKRTRRPSKHFGDGDSVVAPPANPIRRRRSSDEVSRRGSVLQPKQWEGSHDDVAAPKSRLGVEKSSCQDRGCPPQEPASPGRRLDSTRWGIRR